MINMSKIKQTNETHKPIKYLYFIYKWKKKTTTIIKTNELIITQPNNAVV